ncbi:MAG: serine/threonine-protein kinase [Desulfobacterales bacterium]
MESFDAARLVGRQVGSATLLEELARGSMGIVFEAYQHTLKRRIAVKVLPEDGADEEAVRLFTQEALAAAGLAHPHIVPVYEIGREPGFHWFSMPLIRGESLDRRLRRLAAHPVPGRRMLSAAEALAFLQQVLEALDFAHRHGVVHRDVKPANILLADGSLLPLLTDFGIACLRRPGGEALKTARGSPLYMAPEQILEPAADERVDVYAAGVLLFRLLVPELPLIPHRSVEELLVAKSTGKPVFTRRPSEVNPRLDREMDALIAQATAFRREERFASCRRFAEALARYERLHGRSC